MTTMEWRDIATAPKDGTEVILTDGGSIFIGRWNTTFCVWVASFDNEALEDYARIVSWMPLPSLPQNIEYLESPTTVKCAPSPAQYLTGKRA